MSLPTINDVQAVDNVLQSLLIGYMNGDERFAALRAFPGVGVPNDSGTFYKFDKKYWMGDNMKNRAPGAQYARAGFGVSTDTYKTIQWALSFPIADETRANSQVPMDLEVAGVRFLGHQNLIRLERAFAADFMTTGVWDSDNTTATDWDDFTSGDPVQDIKTASRTLSANTAYNANSILLGEIVHDALTLHPDIIDRLKYTQAATAAAIRGALAAIFEVENYLVSRVTYNSANEGQTVSMAAVIDDDCLVFYANQSPSIFEPSAGYTFAWAPGGGTGGMQPVWRDGENDADLLKIKAQWDQKVVATDLGYFFSDIV